MCIRDSHKGWGMFRAHGNLSRMGIVAAGHFAFVLVRERPDGRYTYTLQRTSDGVRFPLLRLYAALNEREGGGEKWGGGDTVGGSPRGGGSRQTPTEVAEVINEVLAATPTWTDEEIDRAFRAATTRVNQQPMPGPPRTIYDLRLPPIK